MVVVVFSVGERKRARDEVRYNKEVQIVDTTCPG